MNLPATYQSHFWGQLLAVCERFAMPISNEIRRSQSVVRIVCFRR